MLPSVEGSPDEEELFSALGHEMRLRVVYQLAKNRDEKGFLQGMTYTELRDAVGATTEDGFSYHLSKLEGTLVRKYERDGRSLYAPTYAGYVVYRAVVGGMLDRPVREETVPIDGDCFYCGGGLVAHLFPGNESLVTVACSDCGHDYRTHRLFDSSVGEGTVDEVLRRTCQRERRIVELCRRGVCHHCAGTVTQRVYPSEELDRGDEKLSYVVVNLCDRCDEITVTSVGDAVRGHPAVVQFFRERGRDVTAVPAWELEFAATDRHTTRVRTDPLRLRVTVECDDDALSVTVDEEVNVLDVAEGVDLAPPAED